MPQAVADSAPSWNFCVVAIFAEAHPWRAIRGAKTTGIFLNDHCRDTALRRSDPGRADRPGAPHGARDPGARRRDRAQSQRAPPHHRQDSRRRAVAHLSAQGVRRLRIRWRGGTQDRDDDLGGLRLDRLGGQWCSLQRPLDRPLPDRSPARGLGWRRGPLHLRLLCPYRDCHPDRWRVCAERHMVVRQRLRRFELGQAGRLYRAPGCEAVLRGSLLSIADR